MPCHMQLKHQCLMVKARNEDQDLALGLRKPLASLTQDKCKRDKTSPLGIAET